MPQYHVERSIKVSVPPQAAFDAIADYGTWTRWSPWLCAEPTASVTVSGNPASVGSIYSWSGDIVGAREIEHKNLQPPQRIEDEIRFLKPFRSIARMSFDITPQTDGCLVTWHMDGSMPWFLFWMTSMIKSFVGMDYDRGLSMLKEWLETGSIAAKTIVCGVKNTDAVHIIGIRNTATWQSLGESMNQAFSDAKEKMKAASLSVSGQMISAYHKFDTKNLIFDYTSGFLVSSETIQQLKGKLPDGLSTWSGPAGTALHVEQTGGYEHIGNGWSAAHQYARSKKLKMARTSTYEIYRNNPSDTDRVDLRTDIYLPVR